MRSSAATSSTVSVTATLGSVENDAGRGTESLRLGQGHISGQGGGSVGHALDRPIRGQVQQCTFDHEEDVGDPVVVGRHVEGVDGPAGSRMYEPAVLKKSYSR